MSAPDEGNTTLGESQSEQDATLSYIIAENGRLLSTVVLSPGERDGAVGGVTVGTVLNDRYELQSVLGQGAMGQVFLGLDRRLTRPVAVKLIRPDHWEVVSSVGVEHVRKAFEDEARLGANLLHPGIATVYDYGFHEERPYTVFEYVPGTTLRDVIKERAPLPIEDVRDIVGQLAEALDYAHERGIVHRDLKPENIRIADSGQCKILDLGLAKDFRAESDWRFAGTPAYASPEQASELPSDGRTDQYALALITYELLTARRPFAADNWINMLEMHRTTMPPSPQTIVSSIPDDVALAVQRSLEKEPNSRFSNCRALANTVGARVQYSVQSPPKFITHCFAKEKLRNTSESLLFMRAHRLLCFALQSECLWIASDEGIQSWPSYSLKGVTRRFRTLRTHFIHRSRCVTRQFMMRTNGEAKDLQSILLNWRTENQLQKTIHDGPEHSLPVLVAGLPNARMQLLGRCEATESTREAADLALQLFGALHGADAIVDIAKETMVMPDKRLYRASGVAAKAIDSASRWEFILRWYRPRCKRICIWLFVIVLAALLLQGCSSVVATNRIAEKESPLQPNLWASFGSGSFPRL